MPRVALEKVGKRVSGREAWEGGDRGIHTDDSLCYTAETNTIVKQLYPIFF